MELMTVLPAILVLSIGFNVFQGYACAVLKRHKLQLREDLESAKKAPPAAPKLDVSAQDLIHDMTRRGHAIVRIEILDPSSILLRSPRD